MVNITDTIKEISKTEEIKSLIRKIGTGLEILHLKSNTIYHLLMSMKT